MAHPYPTWSQRIAQVLTLARKHALADFAHHGVVVAVDGLVRCGSRPWMRLKEGRRLLAGRLGLDVMSSKIWSGTLRAQDVKLPIGKLE